MVLKHKAQFNYKLNSHYLLGGVWLANTGMGWHFSCLHSEKAAAHQGRLLLLELEELEAGWVCAPSSGLQVGAAGAPPGSHPLGLRSPAPALQKGELQHQNQRTDAGLPWPQCLSAVHSFPERPP